jgi:hypothetical protein
MAASKNIGVNPDAVAWEPAFWADLLTEDERKLWDKLSASHGLGWEAVRKFITYIVVRLPRSENFRIEHLRENTPLKPRGYEWSILAWE